MANLQKFYAETCNANYKEVLIETAKFLEQKTSFFKADNWQQIVIELFEKCLRDAAKEENEEKDGRKGYPVPAKQRRSSSRSRSSRGRSSVLANLSDDMFDVSDLRSVSRPGSLNEPFFVPETQEDPNDDFVQIQGDDEAMILPTQESQESGCIMDRSYFRSNHLNSDLPIMTTIPIQSKANDSISINTTAKSLFDEMDDDSSIEKEMFRLVWDETSMNGNISKEPVRISATPDLDFEIQPDENQTVATEANKFPMDDLTDDSLDGGMLQNQSTSNERIKKRPSKETVKRTSNSDADLIGNDQPTQIFIPPHKSTIKPIESVVLTDERCTQLFVRPTPMKQTKEKSSHNKTLPTSKMLNSTLIFVPPDKPIATVTTNKTSEVLTQKFVPPQRTSVYDECTQRYPTNEEKTDDSIYDECTQRMPINQGQTNNPIYDQLTQCLLSESSASEEIRPRILGVKNRIQHILSSESEEEYEAPSRLKATNGKSLSANNNVETNDAVHQKNGRPRIPSVSYKSPSKSVICETFDIITPQHNYLKLIDKNKISEVEKLYNELSRKSKKWLFEDSESDEEQTIVPNLKRRRMSRYDDTLMRSYHEDSMSDNSEKPAALNQENRQKLIANKTTKADQRKVQSPVGKVTSSRGQRSEASDTSRTTSSSIRTTRNASKRKAQEKDDANNTKPPKKATKRKNAEEIVNNDDSPAKPILIRRKSTRKTAGIPSPKPDFQMKYKASNSRTASTKSPDQKEAVTEKRDTRHREAKSSKNIREIIPRTEKEASKKEAPNKEQPKKEAPNKEEPKKVERPKREAIKPNKTNASTSNILTTSTDSDVHGGATMRLRRKSKPTVLFTKIDSKQYEKTIKELGGKVVDNATEGTILVTDKIYRTCKFLCAIAQGIPIVSVDWINEICTKHRFVPFEPFMLQDELSEQRFKFKLTASIETAQRLRVLRNYSIYVTPNTKPTPQELNEIISCAGGKCLLEIGLKPRDGDTVVAISTREDRGVWEQLRKAHPKIRIVNTEGFMLTILQQHINFDKYILR